jgi:hypothetical protein
MKYIKPIFESNDKFTFAHIIEILDELIDDGMDIVIYAANGVAYYPDDISRKDINDVFRFQRYQNSKLNFKISIHFSNINYTQTVDILNRLKSVVGRFDDLGFGLFRFYLNSDNDSDQFALQSLDYHFESYT